MALNARMRLFVEAYNGNATEAARAAGYSGNEASLAKQGMRLSRNVHVIAAIRARESARLKPAIASREERQAFWASVMRDHEQDMRDRLKAAELLGRSEADFTEKLQHDASGSLLAALQALDAARGAGK